MITVTEDTIIDFGRYKGRKLSDVPAWYLIFIYRKDIAGILRPYIQENFESLMKKANKLKKYK
jgi:uncharacterized protein (DUF3820 family)